MNQERWMNMLGATDATPAIPGDGVGSRLNRVTAAKNIVSIVDLTTVELNNTTSITVGMLVITIDGFWGTVTAVASPNITVAQWRNKFGRTDAKPAVAAAALNVFPAGSCLAGMQSARILRLIPTTSVTGVSANYLLDHRMATATPILPYASIQGVLTPIEFGGRISSPFACQIGTVANFDCTVVFEVSS